MGRFCESEHEWETIGDGCIICSVCSIMGDYCPTCIEWEDDKPDPSCETCKGTGVVIYTGNDVVTEDDEEE